MIDDITERMRAEAAGQASEQSYRTLLKNIAGAVYRCRNDADWTVEFISDGCFEITGYRPDEILGNRITSLGALIHPEDAAGVWEKCQANLAAQRACSTEYRIMHRDGAVRWIWDQAQGIYSPSGELLLIEGLLTDITAGKAAKNAADRSLKELRVLYLSSLVFSQSHDPERVGARIIETMEQLLEYRRGSIWMIGENTPEMELLTHSDLGLKPGALEKELARVRALVPRLGEGISGWVALHGELVRVGDVKRDARYLEADPAVQSELCVPLKVGGRTIGAINVESYLPDAFSEEDERLLTTLASQAAIAIENARLFHKLELDLAERKRAEEELRASKQRFHDIFSFAPVGIYQSLHDGTLITANQALAKMLGYASVDELLKVKLGPEIYFEADARQKLIREFEGLGYAVDLDTLWKRKDGSPICVQLSKHAIKRPNGETEYFEGFVRDITAHKRAEDELKKSGKQLRALVARLQRVREEERIRVSREIHDELGQLLTGLKMDVRWLERKLSEPGLSAALNPLLDRAVEASELADSAIATVQKIASSLRPGALDELGLEPALTVEARRFQERSGIRCAVVAEGLLPVLPPDVANDLFYICQEALTNAGRHSRASSVEIRLQTDGDAVVLELCDDGAGMSEAELKSPHALGLIGMRERAAQCGGTISFTPNEPAGTRVTVRVPGERSAKGGAGP